MESQKRVESFTMPQTGTVYTFTWETQDFFDADIALKIDILHLVEDMMTFPIEQNRIGLLKVDAEEMLGIAKMDLEDSLATIYRRLKQTLSEQGKVTEKQLESEVILDPEYRTVKLEYFAVERKVKMITELYWAMQAKGKKLDILSAKIKPEEFGRDLIEGKYNGVLIEKSADNPFVKPTSGENHQQESIKVNRINL